MEGSIPTQSGVSIPGEPRRARLFYNGKPLSFRESLHLCGCAYCRAEIVERSEKEPPEKPDFAAYLAATYPETTPEALRATTPTKDEQSSASEGQPQ